MDQLLATLSSALYLARARRGVTQDELAEALGITPQYYQRLEAGETLPSLPMLYRLARTLEVPVDNLVQPTPIKDNPDLC